MDNFNSECANGDLRNVNQISNINEPSASVKQETNIHPFEHGQYSEPKQPEYSESEQPEYSESEQPEYSEPEQPEQRANQTRVVDRPNVNLEGSIRIVIPDAAYFRTAIDCMSRVRPLGLIRFVKGGILICHQNENGTLLSAIMIYEDEIIDYTVRPAYGSTEAMYGIAHVDFSKMVLSCKQRLKTESYVCVGLIGTNGWLKYLRPTDVDGADNGPCHEPDMSIYKEYVSMVDKYYGGENPSEKVTNSWMVKTMNKFKTYSNSRVTFGFFDEKIFIKGSMGKQDSIRCIPKSGEGDEMEGGDNDISSEDMSAYQIVVDFKTLKDFMILMFKTSHNRAVIKVYFKPGRPLIFLVPVGNMGVAEHVFSNSSSGASNSNILSSRRIYSQ